MVVAVDYERWQQTPDDLRSMALQAAHPRTRERFLALFDIASGSCATAVARATGRSDESLLRWVHAYNERGPEALVFRHTGGRPPFVPPSSEPSAKRSVTRSPPRQRRR
jgi:transposase